MPNICDALCDMRTKYNDTLNSLKQKKIQLDNKIADLENIGQGLEDEINNATSKLNEVNAAIAGAIGGIANVATSMVSGWKNTMHGYESQLNTKIGSLNSVVDQINKAVTDMEAKVNGFSLDLNLMLPKINILDNIDYQLPTVDLPTTFLDGLISDITKQQQKLTDALQINVDLNIQIPRLDLSPLQDILDQSDQCLSDLGLCT